MESKSNTVTGKKRTRETATKRVEKEPVQSKKVLFKLLEDMQEFCSQLCDEFCYADSAYIRKEVLVSDMVDEFISLAISNDIERRPEPEMIQPKLETEIQRLSENVHTILMVIRNEYIDVDNGLASSHDNQNLELLDKIKSFWMERLNLFDHRDDEGDPL